jgi:hypothetical protein
MLTREAKSSAALVPVLVSIRRPENRRCDWRDRRDINKTGLEYYVPGGTEIFSLERQSVPEGAVGQVDQALSPYLWPKKRGGSVTALDIPLEMLQSVS